MKFHLWMADDKIFLFRRNPAHLIRHRLAVDCSCHALASRGTILKVIGYKIWN